MQGGYKMARGLATTRCGLATLVCGLGILACGPAILACGMATMACTVHATLHADVVPSVGLYDFKFCFIHI